MIKLPIDKFTVREREMLIGSGILPPEFFVAAKNPFVIGLGAREYRERCAQHVYEGNCVVADFWGPYG